MFKEVNPVKVLCDMCSKEFQNIHLESVFPSEQRAIEELHNDEKWVYYAGGEAFCSYECEKKSYI